MAVVTELDAAVAVTVTVVVVAVFARGLLHWFAAAAAAAAAGGGGGFARHRPCHAQPPASGDAQAWSPWHWGDAKAAAAAATTAPARVSAATMTSGAGESAGRWRGDAQPVGGEERDEGERGER